MEKIFKNYGKRIAAIQDNQDVLTYDELFQYAAQLNHSIGKRCLVFQLCSNTVASLIGYVSFHLNDIVPLLLAEKIDKELFQSLIEIYHPQYIWASCRAENKTAGFEKVFEIKDYALYKTNLDPYPLNDELALLLTTSGSTGSPKLVRQSYKNIHSNTESIVSYLEITKDELPITTLPMNYTYGLSIINSHLYVGATVLLTDKTLMDKDFWKFFKENSATSFGGVPYTYEMLNRLRFFQMDLPSLRTMTQAGGKLLPDLHKKYAEYAKEHNKKFIVMYGQTEATARMAYLPADKSLEKYGSMGIAIPGGIFKLLDTNNQEINEPEVAGELVYQGDNVTLGYAECGNDLIKGDERNGILHTGDIAKRDKDGYYYIVGRLKRFLKIFGNRVNLDEAERLIKGQFAVKECACTGRDDKMSIFVVEPNQVQLSEIRNFISAKTKLNISAFEVKEIEQIPKNDSGKILYKDLEGMI